MLLQIDDIERAHQRGAARPLRPPRPSRARRACSARCCGSTVANEAPDDARALAGRFRDWFKALSGRLTLSQGLGFLAIALALLALAAPLHWVTRRVIARDPSAPAPDRFRRALAAIWTMAVLAAAPLVALGVFAYALDVFDISDPRLQGALDATLDGLRLIAIVNAVAHGLLSPGRANWRLVNLGDRVSRAVVAAVARRRGDSRRSSGCSSRPPTLSFRSISRSPGARSARRSPRCCSPGR